MRETLRSQILNSIQELVRMNSIQHIMLDDES